MNTKNKPTAKSGNPKPKKTIAKTAGPHSGYLIVDANASAGMRVALQESEEINHLYQGILRSTSDGILTVNRENEVIFSNERFVEMWRIPQETMATKNDTLLLQYVLDQLTDPQSFLKKVQELYHSAEESFDTLYFKDGRIFERLSRPLLDGMEVRGRVWSFRDITERKCAEDALSKSEARLELFFAQSLDGFFFMMLDEPIHWDDSVDKDRMLDYVFVHQRVTKANNAMLAQYGATREQYLRLTPNDFFAHDIAYGKQVWRDFFEKGHLHVDTDERKFDGAQMWIEGDYICLYDGEGRITGHFGIQRDITERKRAEERVRNSEKRFHALIEHGRDNISLLAADGTLLWESPSVDSTLGYAPNQFVGHNIFELMHPDDQAWVGNMYAQVVQSPGNIQEGAFRLVHADGTWRWIECSATNLLHEPSVQAIVINYRDITERKQAERLQDATYRIAQAADQIKSLDSLYPAIHAIIQEVMAAENLYIALYDEESGLISFPYSVDERDSQFPPTKPGKGLTEYVFRAGMSVLCDEQLYAKLIRRGEVELIGEHSLIWLGVPLIVDGKTIGVMAVQDYKNADAYGEREQHILEFVSSRVAMVIHRKQAENKLRESEERFRTILDNIEDGYYEVDLKGSLTFVNRAYANLMGYDENELIGMDYYQYMSPETAKVVFETFNRVYRSRMPEQAFNWEWICKDGTHRSVEISVSPIESADRNIVGFRGIVRDISKRKRKEESLRESEERYHSLFDRMMDGVYSSTHEGKFVNVNPAMLKMFGYSSKEEMLEVDIKKDLYFAPDERGSHILDTGREEMDVYRMRRKDGSEIWVEDHGYYVHDEQGRIIYHEGMLRDITERKQAEEELLRAKDSLETAHRELQQLLAHERVLARTDSLTGLCNRRQFFELAAREFHASVRYQRPLSILMFDADDFKQVNDVFGHAEGDKALAQIAQIAAAQVRSVDVLARYGGDEFVLLLPQADAKQALHIAERLRTSVEATTHFGTDRSPFKVTLSIGIAELQRSPTDEAVEHVIQRADEALYKAKQSGRNRIVIFSRDETGAA